MHISNSNVCALIFSHCQASMYCTSSARQTPDSTGPIQCKGVATPRCVSSIYIKIVKFESLCLTPVSGSCLDHPIPHLYRCYHLHLCRVPFWSFQETANQVKVIKALFRSKIQNSKTILRHMHGVLNLDKIKN